MPWDVLPTAGSSGIADDECDGSYYVGPLTTTTITVGILLLLTLALTGVGIRKGNYPLFLGGANSESDVG